MFYIINQGARIKTPIDTLLKEHGVSQVSAISKLGSISPRGVESEVTNKPVNARKDSEEQKAYQHIERSEKRELVVYAHQIMTSPVLTASMDLSLDVIWRQVSKQGCHHLPLVDEHQHIQGIVSDRDLLRFAANNRDFSNVAIHKMMTRSVITAAADTDVRALAEVMCRRSIGAVPIEDENLNLVGIVSRSDILRTVVNHGALELWA
jgi:acetoin utilization protein AcuB